MKKFIAWSLLCMLGGVPAGAQETDAKAPVAKETKSDVKEASIVFDKTTQDLGTFSEDDPIVKCTFLRLPMRECSVGDSSGYCFMRMHGTHLYPDAGKTRREGQDGGDVQRQRKISGAFQEKHYGAYQCQGAYGEIVYYRCNDSLRKR